MSAAASDQEQPNHDSTSVGRPSRVTASAARDTQPVSSSACITSCPTTAG